MTAIIIDDEPKARSLLRRIIEDHCQNVTVIDEVGCVKAAVKSIAKHNPDVIFLDIEMPNENGFALFDYFDEPSFMTVFCTAYSEYALKAFEVSAIDYLLKPLDIDKIKMAVSKVEKTTNKTLNIEKINILQENLSVRELQKIGLPTKDGLVFVKLENIVSLEADGSYTTIYLIDNQYVVSKKLGEFENLLNENRRFFKTHRSSIVNVNHILHYHKKDGFYFTMTNNRNVVLASDKRLVFEEFIKN